MSENSKAEHAPRFVVTGAGGFVGAHLIRRLRHAGFPVLGVVRTSPPEVSPGTGLEYVGRDLARIDTLEDVLRAGDVVVHLAARVHMMRDDDGRAEAAYRAANVEPTRMLSRSAAARGARRVIYLSTAKVFGEGRERPYTREDAVAPTEAYGRSKVEAEQAVRDAGDDGAFEWTIFRPPFVYGPGGKGNFPRLVALARLSTLLPLPFASVENQRSIVFVGNLVDAILHAATHPRAAGQVLLPTDATDVSTAELLRAIARARGTSARLFDCPPALLRNAARLVGRSAEMERLTESLRLDSRHLRDELGWVPPFTLAAAIERSVRPQAGSGNGRADD